MNRAASRRYLAILISTCDGLPRSVMNAGPRATAGLARPVSSDSLRDLKRWGELAGKNADDSVLIYGGNDPYQHDGVSVVAWFALDPLAQAAA